MQLRERAIGLTQIRCELLGVFWIKVVATEPVQHFAVVVQDSLHSEGHHIHSHVSGSRQNTSADRPNEIRITMLQIADWHSFEDRGAALELFRIICPQPTVTQSTVQLTECVNWQPVDK